MNITDKIEFGGRGGTWTSDKAGEKKYILLRVVTMLPSNSRPSNFSPQDTAAEKEEDDQLEIWGKRFSKKTVCVQDARLLARTCGPA